MSKVTDAQRRKIFKLSTEKGLDKEMLYSYIQSLTGKDSIKDLSVMEAIKVIDALEGKKQNADNMITEKQRKYIEGLAKDIGWVDENNKLDNVRLNGWLENKYNISNINWLTAKKASDAIEGLKAQKSRMKAAI